MLPHTSVYYLFHTKTLYSMFYAPNRYFRQSTSYSMTGFFNMSHPRLFLIYFRSFETVQILERNRRSRDSNSQPLDLSPLPSPLDQCSQNNRFTFDCVSEFIKLPKLQGRGIGCGSVGWAVASNARGPWFEYSIQSSANFYIETFVCC